MKIKMSKCLFWAQSNVRQTSKLRVTFWVYKVAESDKPMRDTEEKKSIVLFSIEVGM